MGYVVGVKFQKALLKKEAVETADRIVENGMENGNGTVPQINKSSPLQLDNENIDPVPNAKVNGEKKSKSKGKKKQTLPSDNTEEVDTIKKRKKEKKLVKNDDEQDIPS